MNAGPPDQGPPEEAPPPPPSSEDAPPPPEPEAAPQYAYAPPPGPATAPPAPRRGLSPIVAIIGIIIILIVAVGGYAAAGYGYAQGRLSSARSAYNTVVDHENKYTDAMNAFAGKISNADINSASTGTAELQQKKAIVTQLVDTSTQQQSQLDADDASLAKADSDLKQNSWLTAIDKSELDKASTRIGHMRKALADAKTVTADYIQVGTFYESLYDVVIDEIAVGSALDSSSFTAIGAAVSKIKTDLAKAVSLDKGQGVVPEYDSYLKDIQAVVNDLTALLDAAAKNDQAAVDAASAALTRDGTKADSHDFAKMDSATQAFFQPLINDYNSEIDKANNT